MEENLFTFQLFTPGSDIAIGFRPSQIIWGRTGNDVLLGYQPTTPNPNPLQVDVLLGDLAIEDPTFRQWQDNFILGDWVRPYYTGGSSGDGSTSLALVADFTPDLDVIELYGTADDYELLDIGLGTFILFSEATELDPIGFLLGATDLSLTESYFQFKGIAPPSGPVLPQIQQFGSTEYDIPLSISTDPTGNIYVAGGTNGSLAEENAGLRDNFIVKYDSDGNVLFTQQFGTSDFETIYGIDTDNQGNFYVTGTTAGDLAEPKQAEELDTFVAKYDSNGNQTWIRQVGQNVVFNAFNLAVDKETGDVFISGADLKTDPVSFLEDDTFVIKFDTDGNQQWLTETGVSGFLSFDESYGLTVAQDGSVYATGWTSGDLGGPNAGLYDNWLAKYDNATGATEWIVQYGTPDYEWSWDVRTDSVGNVYTTGWTLGDLGGTNAGSFDAYLAKFDDQGNLLWTEQFGTSDDDQAYSLYIDKNDNIFIGGYTDGSLGGSNAGSFDAWIAKYDQSGNQSWITQFGTSNRDELYGLVADDLGNLYATGVTQGSLGALNNGSFDGWTAKLDAASGTLLTFDGSEATEPVPLDGSGGQNTFTVASSSAIQDFGGVGRGHIPEANRVDEIDTLRFEGEGLTAKNLLLTQEGKDLRLSFKGVEGPEVILQNFALENLDNLPGGAGNILFNGDKKIKDSFDIFNADSTQDRIFNRNTVTFLNYLDIAVRGFDHSDDIINAQGGNKTIMGLSGDDTLRGAVGDDILDGGLGSDLLTGGGGSNTFRFGSDLLASCGGDIDIITDFTAADSFDFGGFLGAGGQLSVQLQTSSLMVNLNNGDAVMVQGDFNAAFNQLSPLAMA
ncbi:MULTISPECIES: SBBP repeat-containing protein [Cyanophyceae]|uniref:SBBP repeat-containing protein n=1 Tax=Cyanophyceae TaxID=3028117 RepID=UPI001683000B|nr:MULTISPECIES: SBBP repeat-containing protein [Cyanophyceae]MBD1915162.1 SBBP repeat-containing protein [Phormidium sp. FACHB-77]MBD2028450.1 SBBP repeat-containing protein [Phormidium sp. FACHB-322]MBD2051844.1 SBBP repeat-containing protein [Leptolyngbya sp. FACHB-60]